MATPKKVPESRGQLADGPVALIGDQDVAAGVHGQRARIPELCLQRRATVTGRSADPVPRHRVDVPRGHGHPEPGAGRWRPPRGADSCRCRR